MSDDDEIESFMIEDDLCQQIANMPQDDDCVEVIRREVAEEGKEEE